MIYKIHFTIFLILISAICRSQDIENAKRIVKTLSSPAFEGRGYVNNGIQKSADFIRNEFDSIGLIPLFDSYMQPFLINVNTFPGNMDLSINGKALKPGIDFIVDPFSKGLNGKYSSEIISYKKLSKQKVLNKTLRKCQNKILIVDKCVKTARNKETVRNDSILAILKYNTGIGIAGLMELVEEKLSWYVSPVEFSRPSFTVKCNSVKPKFKSVDMRVDNKYIENYPVANVAGYLKGSVKPDTLIVITAHFDHLGKMGTETYFPGANDNASGTAMLLNLASFFKNHPPDYSILFIAFAAEEAGLKGSEYFVSNPGIDLKKIRFLINFDLTGTGEEGIMVVNGTVHKDKFETLNTINNLNHYLPEIKPRGVACNSDHCYFHESGIPCFYIYTLGGSKAYHDIYDTFEATSMIKFTDLQNLTIDFIKSF